MGLFICLGIIIAGLCWVGFSFFKELKSGGLDEVGSIRSAPESAPGGILGERFNKLEQMLEEKNRLLSVAAQDLLNERAQRGEFDKLKEILQQQIEDLKAQNKRVKEDLTKALNDNSELRSRMASIAFMDDPARTGKNSPQQPSEKFEQFFNSKAGEVPALSLHDVFEKDKKII
ncbi:MAG: hypothetical protein HQL20_11450 [Candidatus Omnitrophica bacterium]|nr:hypothetical protein [Candidatus Omnitrophota bacterium]